MTGDQVQTPQGNTTEREVGPPMPMFVVRIVNPIVAALLRSPLHGLISKHLMLLTFHGRTTGKRYTLPVGYIQKGQRLFIFSHSRWRKNLYGGAPVSVRLRGRQRNGIATRITDPAVIEEFVQALVAQRGEAMARRMGIVGEDGAVEHPTADGDSRTVFIEIRLEEPQP